MWYLFSNFFRMISLLLDWSDFYACLLCFKNYVSQIRKCFGWIASCSERKFLFWVDSTKKRVRNWTDRWCRNCRWSEVRRWSRVIGWCHRLKCLRLPSTSATWRLTNPSTPATLVMANWNYRRWSDAATDRHIYANSKSLSDVILVMTT